MGWKTEEETERHVRWAYIIAPILFVILIILWYVFVWA